MRFPIAFLALLVLFGLSASTCTRDEAPDSRDNDLVDSAPLYDAIDDRTDQPGEDDGENEPDDLLDDGAPVLSDLGD